MIENCIIHNIEDILLKKNKYGLYDLYGTLVLKDPSTQEIFFTRFDSQNFSLNTIVNSERDLIGHGYCYITTNEKTKLSFELEKNENAIKTLFGDSIAQIITGVRPKKLLDEERKQELKEAIQEYLSINKTIPSDWIEELNGYLSCRGEYK